MVRRSRKQSVFVVKNAPREIDEKHKELNSKSVYLLKDDDQAIYRYQDTIYSFVDKQDGLFLILSHDRTFYQTLRQSLYKELEIAQERTRLLTDIERAKQEIKIFREHGKPPFLFVETMYDANSTIPFIEEVKHLFPDLFVVLLMTDAEEKLLAQFLEAGVDNFITKPVSFNLLLEKIANTLIPPDTINRLVREAKLLVVKGHHPKAYALARTILEKKTGSPAGLMVMGDALKGMGKRKEALDLYVKAVENAPQYLDPRKKLVEFYREDGDTDAVLKHLRKIDELSPLHQARKQEIGDILYDKGDYPGAAGFYLDAVVIARGFKNKNCVRMAEEYAAKLFKKESSLATDLLRLCSKLAATYDVELHWSVYNRLGMLLLKQNRWQEAVDAYENAVALSPDDATLRINMGMAYVEGKDFGSAAQKFERAMTIDPECYHGNLRMAYTMGEAFFHARRPGNAKKVLSYIHEVDPNFKRTKTLLKALEPPNK